MRNNLAINILRWIIAVPAGLMLWFSANYSIGSAFGIIHGFELVDSFWEAPDMDGMPIIGTYIMFVTRTIAAASLVGVTIYIVPRYHKQVAIVVASLVSAAAVVILLFQVMSADLNVDLGGWYRNILEMLSIIFGAIFGAWLAYGNQKRRARV
jgi:glucan phosphoethanolaminetransferase (alkaline phosphatase superfamily)